MGNSKVPKTAKSRLGKFYVKYHSFFNPSLCEKKERFERRIFEPRETYQPNGPTLKLYFKSCIRQLNKNECYKNFDILRIYCAFQNLKVVL